MFGFINIPLSDYAESIGYESRYLIYNSGSMTLFLWVTLILQFLVIPILLRLPCKKNRFYAFLLSQQQGYFWVGFCDFINETSLNWSFCVVLNYPTLCFTTWSDAINGSWTCLIGVTLLLYPFVVNCGLHKSWKDIYELAKLKNYLSNIHQYASQNAEHRAATENQLLEGGQEDNTAVEMS